jgi:Ser/Thr protein kinase RdoA (MazF antagonist)
MTFPTASAVLSTKALEEQVLSQYELEKPVYCYLWRWGLNDTYVVYTGQNKALLRVYANTTNQHTQATVQAEIDILNFLANHDVPVATAIQRKDRRWLTEIPVAEGVRHAVLFKWIEGTMPPDLTPEISYQAGQALAQFHTTMDSITVPFERHHSDIAYLIDKPLERIKAFPLFANNTKQLAYLSEVCQMLRQKVQMLPHTAPAYGICHGDFMNSNTIVDNNGKLVIIDFDFANYGWRLLDIGTFIWIEAINKKPVHREFLQGYDAVRPLSDMEHEVLPYFVLLRHIWLLGGSGLLNIHRHGVEWLSGDYFDKFIIFIRDWFRER